MRAVFFVGAAISLIPLFALGVFNGMTIVGLILVFVATVRIIRKEGLS